MRGAGGDGLVLVEEKANKYRNGYDTKQYAGDAFLHGGNLG
jgi:hypothetical protein